MVLSAKRRRSLPKSAFVYPPGSRVGGKTGKYPIDTKARARAALAYGARSSTAGSAKTIRAKVTKRYPSLKKR
jgi:hypothetical protein